MYTLAADPQPWNGRSRWLAVLLVEPGHRDTIQMRHSMPQEAAKTDSSYSYVRTDRFAPGPNGAAGYARLSAWLAALAAAEPAGAADASALALRASPRAPDPPRH